MDPGGETAGPRLLGLALSLSLGLTGCGGGGARPPPQSDQILALQSAQENSLPGDKSWRIAKHSTGHELEGYALRSTVAPGEAVEVAASVDRPETVSWSVFRLGFYKGDGARRIGYGGATVLSSQTPCHPRPGDGLVACGWQPSLRYHVPRDAPSGVYVMKLSRADRLESYVPFVVRRHHERGDVLVALATSTWAAYNLYGGTSLYVDLTRPQVSSDGRAFRVSYDRPFLNGDGAGFLLSNELAAIRWLESQNLRILYATSEDFDAEPDLLQRTSVLVLAGHDEYWTQTRRDLTDTAVDQGLSLLLLSANTGYWRTRLEPSGDGRERRVVTCYKLAAPGKDPAAPQGPLTTQFRLSPGAQPESSLFGVMYQEGESLPNTNQPILLRRTDHWAFEGTGFRPGDTVWQANGYEVDDITSSSPEGVTVLARSPLISLVGGVAWGAMVLRDTPAGGLVFAAGGIDFVRALSGAGVADPGVQRLVANVLYRALGRPVPGLHLFSREAGTQPVVDKVRPAGVFAGVPGSPGIADGPPGQGKLDAPLALTFGPDGSLLVTDAGAKSVRRIARNGTLSTISGLPPLGAPVGIAADRQGRIWIVDGDNGVVLERQTDGTVRTLGAQRSKSIIDGPADRATFDYPAGLALSPDQKALYVADRGARSLRKIDLTVSSRTVSSFAGGQVGRPTALAVTPQGAIYVQDDGSRIFLYQGGKVTLVAGNGTLGFRDGPASTARFLGQAGLALMPDGALLIADSGNYRIRELKAGQVTTFAGNGRGTDDPGQPSALVLPAGLAAGPDHKVYVAEAGNSAIRVLQP